MKKIFSFFECSSIIMVGDGMKSKGFTLVELLGIIAVLSIIALIATPVIQTSVGNNRNKMYGVIKEQIIDAAKDWATVNISSLPQDDGDYVDVTIADLKTAGILKISVTNPKNEKSFSNESYIRITKIKNNFSYELFSYDLVDAEDVEVGAPVITLNGDQLINLSIGDTYTELGTIEDDVSIQIIQNKKEVSSVDTAASGTYTIYYSLLEDGKLGINIRTVIVK